MKTTLSHRCYKLRQIVLHASLEITLPIILIFNPNNNLTTCIKSQLFIYLTVLLVLSDLPVPTVTLQMPPFILSAFITQGREKTKRAENTQYLAGLLENADF